MSNQCGIDDIVPEWLFSEADTSVFDDPATPLWAVCVEVADAWQWQQSVAVLKPNTLCLSCGWAGHHFDVINRRCPKCKDGNISVVLDDDMSRPGETWTK